MKLRSEYQLLERTVEDAAAFVWRRAFKHDENPPIISEAQDARLQAAIREEIMNAICEEFILDGVFKTWLRHWALIFCGERTPFDD